MNDLNDILSRYGIPSSNTSEESQENRMEEVEENTVQDHDEILQEEHENQEDEPQDSQSVVEEFAAMDREERQGMEDDDTNEGSDENLTLSPEAATSNASSPEELQEEIPEESLLPSNSPTLLIDESTSRFSGAKWYKAIQKTKVILAGLGGIGRKK